MTTNTNNVWLPIDLKLSINTFKRHENPIAMNIYPKNILKCYYEMLSTSYAFI